MLLALTALPACRSWSAPPPQPALITHPTAQSRADLEHAVSQALHGAHVRLADDALTRDSSLIIGRAQARGVNGIPLNGRALEHPQHFRLLLRGSQCVLLHVETGKSRTLQHTTCRLSLERHAPN
jgi:hypothetical protein